MNTRTGRYPAKVYEFNNDIHEISLLDDFSVGFGLNYISHDITAKFYASAFLIHKNTEVPLYTLTEISTFSGFIDSFSKNMMVYAKVYTERDITYTYTKKKNIDYLNIKFDYHRSKDDPEYDIFGQRIEAPEPDPETLGNQVMTISLDRAQCNILAKEFPKALQRLHSLYLHSIKKELSDYNFDVMQIESEHY